MIDTLNDGAVAFYIDVLGGRQKVLLIGASQHTDLAALREAISVNENYELTTTLLENFKEPLTDYDLIVLHQAGNARNINLVPQLQEIIKADQPLWLIGGGWQNLEFQFGIQSKQVNRNLSSEAQAIANEGFTLFTVDESLQQMKNFPPLAITSANVANPNSNSTKRSNQQT